MARDLRGQSTRFDRHPHYQCLPMELKMRPPCGASTSSSYFVEAFSFRTSHIRLPVLTMRRTSNPVILSDGRISISLYFIPPNLSREVVRMKDLVIPEKESVTSVLVLLLTERTKWMPNVLCNVTQVVVSSIGAPSTSCEMIILRNSGRGKSRNIRVCMGIFMIAQR